MIHILHLPLELLTLIAGFAIPESVAAWTLTCKTFRDAVGPLLHEYNALRRRFRHFEYDLIHELSSEAEATGESDLICSTVELLLRIAENPTIPSYIETADLRGGVQNGFYNCSTQHEIRALEKLWYDRQLMRQVSNLLSSTPCFLESGLDPEKFLRDAMAYESPVPPGSEPRMIVVRDLGQIRRSALLDVFLLTLLPNVRELTPPPISPSSMLLDDAQQAWKLLDWIVGQASNLNVLRLPALAKVEVVVPAYEPDFVNLWELQDMEPFWTLPAIKFFYGAGLVAFDDQFEIEFCRRYDRQATALDTVWLRECCIDTENMRRFLSSCGPLKSFRFSFETKRDSCGNWWDAGGFVRAVEDATYQTLEDLSVSVSYVGERVGSRVVSLKGFVKLKRLEIDIGCLEQPPFSDREGSSNSDSDSDQEMSSLEDLLPSSIEDVTLLSYADHDGRHALGVLLRGFTADTKSERFPHLRHLKVVVGLTLVDPLPLDSHEWDPVKEALEAVGGEVTQLNGPALPTFDL